MTTLAPSFLIGSSLFLQVTRTPIKSWIGSKLGSSIINYHWGGGLTALGFGPDQIRTLVSMATDSSHRVLARFHR